MPDLLPTLGAALRPALPAVPVPADQLQALIAAAIAAAKRSPTDDLFAALAPFGGVK